MTATEAEIIKILAEEKNMRKAAERLFLTQLHYHKDYNQLKRTGVQSFFLGHKKG
ncbi:DNA-binding transcriptional LysR family regulator OS=Ureibacillus acetophenoni OX=614649 GN=SAMN05877842_101296 PE=3 SV=1 [Ureibacillus acetophenoni]